MKADVKLRGNALELVGDRVLLLEKWLLTGDLLQTSADRLRLHGDSLVITWGDNQYASAKESVETRLLDEEHKHRVEIEGRVVVSDVTLAEYEWFDPQDAIERACEIRELVRRRSDARRPTTVCDNIKQGHLAGL